jgi:Holliday junction resolvasome RuvABC ATP-dependent DNA helicase subunit
MALHTKYRPPTFDKIVGHTAIIRSVKTTLGGDKDTHAWLFSGPSGVGKTTISRITAKVLGATDSGIFEWNIANLRGVEPIRELAEKAVYRVPGSPVSVYILDECHQMTVAAQNILLKLLEDPPPHVYLILCTTEPDVMLPTIRTRCLEYKLEALCDEDIRTIITTVAEAEHIDLGLEVRELIVTSALGSARLALVLLAKCREVGTDLDQAIPLVKGSIQDMEITGPVDLAKRVIDLMYGTQQIPWNVIVEVLRSKVLRKRVAVKDFKLALIGVLGRIILYSPSAWAVESALLLEANLFGINTEGGLVALLYKIWSDCPAKALSGRVRDTLHERPVKIPASGGRKRSTNDIPKTELM